VRIEIVHLQNIRSHVKSTIPFGPGFNCLVGGLGSGKSSILYSIDFALFGEPIGRSFNYLLRDGADMGRISVHFVQNGKNYKIVRGLRRRGKSINQDFDELKLFEGENLISSGKSEAVIEQLKAIIGLDKELFREIVWMRQEHLKELLNARPRERQKRLDELFGLLYYETAWSSLGGYQKEYEGEKRAYENDPDVVGMEELSIEYNQTAEEFSVLEIELQDVTKKLTVAKKTMEKADLNLRKLEDVKKQNETLKHNEAKAHANLLNVQDAITSLTSKIQKKETAIEDLRKRLNSMDAQIESFKAELEKMEIPGDQPIEALRRSLTQIDNELANLKGEKEATLRIMQTDRNKTTSLSTENRCPLCLQTLTEDYKNNLMQKMLEEKDRREKTLDQLQKHIEKLQYSRSKTSVAFSGLQTVVPRIDELKTRIREDTATLNGLSYELSEKQKLQKEMTKRLESIRTELSRFDSTELETAKSLSRRAFQQYSSLESELQSKENGKKLLTRRLDDVKDRIDQAQQKIERMGKISEAVELISGIRDAYRSIQPKLRSEFVTILRSFVQQVMDKLVADEGPPLNVLIDENYTPYILSDVRIEREVSHLSGGERTLLAFAYRIGLGQLIIQSRTGHGLSMLLLDEPTESLGIEDGSIDRLAEAISNFKAIEQTIAVTHSEAFADKAEHVIRLEKETGESKFSLTRANLMQ